MSIKETLNTILLEIAEMKKQIANDNLEKSIQQLSNDEKQKINRQNQKQQQSRQTVLNDYKLSNKEFSDKPIRKQKNLKKKKKSDINSDCSDDIENNLSENKQQQVKVQKKLKLTEDKSQVINTAQQTLNTKNDMNYQKIQVEEPFDQADNIKIEDNNVCNYQGQQKTQLENINLEQDLKEIDQRIKTFNFELLPSEIQLIKQFQVSMENRKTQQLQYITSRDPTTDQRYYKGDIIGLKNYYGEEYPLYGWRPSFVETHQIEHNEEDLKTLQKIKQNSENEKVILSSISVIIPIEVYQILSKIFTKITEKQEKNKSQKQLARDQSQKQTPQSEMQSEKVLDLDFKQKPTQEKSVNIHNQQPTKGIQQLQQLNQQPQLPSQQQEVEGEKLKLNNDQQKQDTQKKPQEAIPFLLDLGKPINTNIQRISQSQNQQTAQQNFDYQQLSSLFLNKQCQIPDKNNYLLNQHQIIQPANTQYLQDEYLLNMLKTLIQGQITSSSLLQNTQTNLQQPFYKQ